jgi:flagellar protein FlbB
LLLVLVLAVGGLLWFDYLDLVDARDYLDPILMPVFEFAGLRTRTRIEDVEDPLLLDKERLKVQMESLSLAREDLDRREEALQAREVEAARMMDELAEREKALEEREKSFNERIEEYENKRVNLEKKVNYLVGMPPDKAVAMLLEYDNDMDIIDLFRTADEMAARAGEVSLVAYWLSLMPAKRGAELTRKMGKN